VAIPGAAKLVCIKAPKGSGKTELIAAMVDEATRNGQRAWVITYREQLGVQLARRFSLPYKTEVRRSQEGKLLGLCMLHRLTAS
jgi:late competence protein required for DNA uptake (superfamily II DNA/RNA helicase)